MKSIHKFLQDGCNQNTEINIGVSKKPKWESDPKKTIDPQISKAYPCAEVEVFGKVVPKDVADQGEGAVMAYCHKQTKMGKLLGGRGNK